MSDRIRLTFFGTAAGFPTKKRAHTTSIGLWRGEALYLFDAGAGLAQQFAAMDIDPDATRAIFLTHTHADHVGGLAPLLQSIQLNKRADPLPLYVPDASLAGVRDYLYMTYLYPLSGFDLDLRPVAEGFEYEEDGIEVSAVPSRHLVAGEEARRQIGARAEPQAFSYRVRVADKTVYVSGDIAEPEEAAEYGAEADIAVVELAHFEPEEVGAALSASGVKRLVVTHLLASLESSEAEIPDRVMAAGFEGEVAVAQDGMEIEL
jgi:ribonuclease BN (tRNA processing enzyme)